MIDFLSEMIDFLMSILSTPFCVHADKTSNFVDLFVIFFWHTTFMATTGIMRGLEEAGSRSVEEALFARNEVHQHVMDAALRQQEQRLTRRFEVTTVHVFFPAESTRQTPARASRAPPLWGYLKPMSASSIVLLFWWGLLSHIFSRRRSCLRSRLSTRRRWPRSSGRCGQSTQRPRLSARCDGHSKIPCHC